MKPLHAAQRPALLLMSLLLVLTAGNAFAKTKDHGYLGVMLQDISGSMAKALQLGKDKGVLINDVVDDSPAAAAGLEAGDVILEFDGKEISGSKSLTKAVRATSPGDEVALTILHNGTRQATHVELGKAKARRFTYSFDTDSDAPDVEFFGHGDHAGHGNVWVDDDGGERKVIVITDKDDSDRGFMGVELDNLNDQLGEYFGAKDGKGALISKVSDDSPAAAAGLRAGDVILKVDGEEIDDAGDVHEAMADTEPEQEIEVAILRKGKKKTVKVTLGEAPERSISVHTAPFDEDFDFDFPAGMPHGMSGRHDLHKMLMINDDEEDLAEVRAELEQLRAELQELKSELKK